MSPNRSTANLVTFNEEILHRKLYFLRIAVSMVPLLVGPAKWRVTVSGELRFMTSYLES